MPETIARFPARGRRSSLPLTLKAIRALPHTFEPARTPSVLRRYESGPGLEASRPRGPLSPLLDRPRGRRDRAWSGSRPAIRSSRRSGHTPAARRSTSFGRGATFHSLQHGEPARIDFYRARVVDGLGQVVHERLFAVEDSENGEPRLREPGLLGNFAPPAHRPRAARRRNCARGDGLAARARASAPFLEETRRERSLRSGGHRRHVELSLTELLQKADEEIGRGIRGRARGVAGAEAGWPRPKPPCGSSGPPRAPPEGVGTPGALTLQAVERLASVLVLPHPEREAAEVRRLQPNFETEAIAMRVVMEHEQARGRQVYDVHEKNLGYDVHEPRSQLRRAAPDRGQGASPPPRDRSCSPPTNGGWPRTGATATGSTSSRTAPRTLCSRSP